MELNLHPSWIEALGNDEFSKPYFVELMEFLKIQYATKTVYPKWENVFRALNLCELKDIKVVIIGQDPYHGAGQANGLAFSVNRGVATPPSLRNIFKEIRSEYPEASDTIFAPEMDIDLERWARQGVLLLNSVLTVEKDSAASHACRGWEQFTDRIVECIATNKENVVYMLWGAYAQRKGAIAESRAFGQTGGSVESGTFGQTWDSVESRDLAKSGDLVKSGAMVGSKAGVDSEKNLVLKTSHPSPLSAHRGFLGSGHFIDANLYLTSKGLEPINW